MWALCTGADPRTAGAFGAAAHIPGMTITAARRKPTGDPAAFALYCDQASS